ncbi:MAG: hypothetical protein C4555_05090 [Dehalococcoidia bacterium]|nr:MAG: hypothetical protein C4555_05090 [Dehalococcoidia bacterium]
MRRFAIIYIILALLIAGSLWDAANAGGTGVGWKGGKPTSTTVLSATSGTATGLTNVESAAATITAFTATTGAITTFSTTNATATNLTVTTLVASELLAPRYASVSVLGYNEVATTGDGKATMYIPHAFNGWYITEANARITYTVAYATTPMDIAITKVSSEGAEALAYSLTVLSQDLVHSTTGTSADRQISYGDYLRFDIDTIHDIVAAKGLMIYLNFMPTDPPSE